MTSKRKAALVSAVAIASALATMLDAGAVAAQSPQGGYPSNGPPNSSYPNSGYPNGGYPNNGSSNDPYQGGGYQNGNNGEGSQRQDSYQGDQYPDNRYQGGPDQQNRSARAPGPPAGQYAPPPNGYERPGSVYDYRAQQYDRDYADRYSRWAGRYCIDRRNNNTAAGAVIGGVLGAIIGSGVAGRGDRGAGAVIGGALGAGTGAIIGSDSSGGPGGCPPGYYVRSGTPGFYYGGPAYGVVTGPSWYNPWIWSGGVWVYRPYRYWYFNQGNPYWRPDWRPGSYRYQYRRW